MKIERLFEEIKFRKKGGILKRTGLSANEFADLSAQEPTILDRGGSVVILVFSDKRAKKLLELVESKQLLHYGDEVDMHDWDVIMAVVIYNVCKMDNLKAVIRKALQ